jgi:hypothetical protein
MIVVMVREIIDGPTQAFFLHPEAMPWMYPDTPENYLSLIRAIDRPAFAVHLTRSIWSPARSFSSTTRR